MLGTGASPIAGPVDAVRLACEDGWEAAHIAIVPLEILFSPAVALLDGAMSDLAYPELGYDPPLLQQIVRPWHTFVWRVRRR